jgi:hypothetical protein
MKANEWILDENKGVILDEIKWVDFGCIKRWIWMKANGWILDENKGVDIGRKQTSGFWMEKRVDIG